MIFCVGWAVLLILPGLAHVGWMEWIQLGKLEWLGLFPCCLPPQVSSQHNILKAAFQEGETDAARPLEA